MRVLLVSQEFPPETGWGGIGTYVDVLSEALGAAGVDVHVLSVVDRQAARTRQVGRVTIHRRPLPHVRGAHRPAPEVWWRAWLALNVARLVKRLRIEPDVVECPEWMAEGLALGLRGMFPLVVRLHSTARQVFPHSGQGDAATRKRRPAGHVAGGELGAAGERGGEHSLKPRRGGRLDAAQSIRAARDPVSRCGCHHRCRCRIRSAAGHVRRAARAAQGA